MPLKPRYNEIANDLRRRIHDGEWGSGDLLPSERQICDTYSASRNTTRLALRTLISEGIVGSIEGRGYYVREWAPLVYYATHSEQRERRRAAAADVWRTDVIEQGRKPGQQLTVWRDQPPPEHATNALGLQDDDAVIVRHRVRLVDGSPYSISIAYWRADLFGETEIAADRDLQPGPNHIAADMGFEQVKYRDEIRTHMPTPDEAKTLQLGPGIPIAEHSRTGYTKNDIPVRLTVTLLPGDKWLTVYEVPGDDN